MMLDRHFGENDAPSHSEDSFDERIAGAFESMGPSDEAQARMLAALQAAAASSPARKQRAPWRVALPVAASLVIVVGVGIVAFGHFGAALDANLASSSGSASVQESSALAPLSDSLPDASSSNDEGAAEPDAGSAASDKGVAESAAEPDIDARYPYVALPSGERLRIALGDGAVLAADPSVVGEEIGVGVASNDTGDEIPCTVFATSDVEHPFAVRFGGSETLLLADYDES